MQSIPNIIAAINRLLNKIHVTDIEVIGSDRNPDYLAFRFTYNGNRYRFNPNMGILENMHDGILDSDEYTLRLEKFLTS